MEDTIIQHRPHILHDLGQLSSQIGCNSRIENCFPLRPPLHIWRSKRCIHTLLKDVRKLTQQNRPAFEHCSSILISQLITAHDDFYNLCTVYTRFQNQFYDQFLTSKIGGRTIQIIILKSFKLLHFRLQLHYTQVIFREGVRIHAKKNSVAVLNINSTYTCVCRVLMI